MNLSNAKQSYLLTEKFDSCDVKWREYQRVLWRQNGQIWLHGAVNTIYSAIPQRNTSYSIFDFHWSLVKVVGEFWQLWQLSRDASSFLTSELSNLAPLSCKHHLQCNSLKNHICLAFYIFMSLVSEFWQLWRLSRDASKVLNCYSSNHCQIWLHGTHIFLFLEKKEKKFWFYILRSLVNGFRQLWQLSRDANNVFLNVKTVKFYYNCLVTVSILKYLKKKTQFAQLFKNQTCGNDIAATLPHLKAF